VQIQAHSEPKEEKGVAIAAMHTDGAALRAPGTNKTKLTPWDDPNSLVLASRRLWPKPLVVTDGDKFVAKRSMTPATSGTGRGHAHRPGEERSQGVPAVESQAGRHRALRGSIRRTGLQRGREERLLDALNPPTCARSSQG